MANDAIYEGYNKTCATIELTRNETIVKAITGAYLELRRTMDLKYFTSSIQTNKYSNKAKTPKSYKTSNKSL